MIDSSIHTFCERPHSLTITLSVLLICKTRFPLRISLERFLFSSEDRLVSCQSALMHQNMEACFSISSDTCTDYEMAKKQEAEEETYRVANSACFRTIKGCHQPFLLFNSGHAIFEWALTRSSINASSANIIEWTKTFHQKYSHRMSSITSIERCQVLFIWSIHYNGSIISEYICL